MKILWVRVKILVLFFYSHKHKLTIKTHIRFVKNITIFSQYVLHNGNSILVFEEKNFTSPRLYNIKPMVLNVTIV